MQARGTVLTKADLAADTAGIAFACIGGDEPGYNGVGKMADATSGGVLSTAWRYKKAESEECDGIYIGDVLYFPTTAKMLNL